MDLDEEAIAREVSISRAAKRRLGDLNKRMKELDDREAKLAAIESDPGSYLRERGINAEEWAAKELARKAQRGLMSPEEQRLAELEEENQGLKSKWEEHERTTQERAATEAQDKKWALEQPKYMAAMEKQQLPRDMAVLGVMAKVGREFEQALGEGGFSPEDVVAETSARLTKFADRYVFSLPVEALAAKLGKERVDALMKHRVEAFRAAQAGAEESHVQTKRT